MRRILLVAGATGTLLLGSLPAFADTSTTRVDGSNFSSSGVALVGQGCTDPTYVPSQPPEFSIVRGGRRSPAGSRHIGWTPRGIGYSIGPRVHIDEPSKVSSVTWSVKAAGEVEGVATATYYPPNSDNVWRGTASLRTMSNDQWQTVDATSTGFAWREFDGRGVQLGTAPLQDFVGFVRSHGGDGEGLDLGFGYGCSGNQFFIDDLRIASGPDTKVWDFEGYATRTNLTTSSRALVYGAKLKLSARLRSQVTSEAQDGRVVLQSRRAGAKKWKTIKRLRTGQDGIAGLKFMPAHNAKYRAVYAGNVAYHGSQASVSVKVRPNIRARLKTKTVIQGRPFRVTGRFLPNRRAKVALQQYVGNGKWKTRQSTRARKNGYFTLRKSATQLGQSYWRVRVAAGGGNTWGASRSVRLTVKPKPRPSGGGGGGGSQPPPPPVNPPEPPPTQPPPPPLPPTGPLRTVW